MRQLLPLVLSTALLIVCACAGPNDNPDTTQSAFESEHVTGNFLGLYVDEESPGTIELLSDVVTFDVWVGAHTLPPTPPGPEYWYEIEVTLTIVDAGQSVVGLFTDSVPYTPSCTHCVVHSWAPVWDGTDTMGEVVAPGTYTYAVSMTLTAYDASNPRVL